MNIESILLDTIYSKIAELNQPLVIHKINQEDYWIERIVKIKFLCIVGVSYNMWQYMHSFKIYAFDISSSY